jgi:hypothetical protein
MNLNNSTRKSRKKKNKGRIKEAKNIIISFYENVTRAWKTKRRIATTAPILQLD